jgi:hypothetical protein
MVAGARAVLVCACVGVPDHHTPFPTSDSDVVARDEQARREGEPLPSAPYSPNAGVDRRESCRTDPPFFARSARERRSRREFATRSCRTCTRSRAHRLGLSGVVGVPVSADSSCVQSALRRRPLHARRVVAAATQVHAERRLCDRGNALRAAGAFVAGSKRASAPLPGRQDRPEAGRIWLWTSAPDRADDEGQVALSDTPPKEMAPAANERARSRLYPRRESAHRGSIENGPDIASC